MSSNRAQPPDAIPITVLVPDGAGNPIVVVATHTALRMAIVERRGVHALTDEWETPGIYLLLDHHAPDGTWGVYVGKAPGGMRTRLSQHLKGKDHWHRAVLIQRDTTLGFNSAEVGWLEGRLYDMCAESTDAQLHNVMRPSDETLPPYERQMLELLIPPITRILRLVGHDPSSGDVIAHPAPRSARYFGVTTADLVEAGFLRPGTLLVSVWNTALGHTARVCEGGLIEMNGTKYETPTAAAVMAKGGQVKGWDFWAVDGQEKTTLAEIRTQYLDTAR
jgi:hypothetical protein